jgi:hypothetical protein
MGLARIFGSKEDVGKIQFKILQLADAGDRANLFPLVSKYPDAARSALPFAAATGVESLLSHPEISGYIRDHKNNGKALQSAVFLNNTAATKAILDAANSIPRSTDEETDARNLKTKLLTDIIVDRKVEGNDRIPIARVLVQYGADLAEATKTAETINDREQKVINQRKESLSAISGPIQKNPPPSFRQS